ncbi:MAG: Flp pilus assembly complex ATPase component TadA [Deltaproteobacteria bacterium]|jgi:type IV pilus assembly protein PilB|nr:Flp pilus assembly complex ATPase component TadA [Deltaproteobacteria bacterium]
MGEATFKLLDNIGQELVDSGLISADQFAVVQETKKNLGGDIGHILIRKGFLTKDQILEFLSQRLNVPFVTLTDYTIDPDVAKLVPISLAKKYHFMPLFKIEDTLTIAMADPLDVFAIDEIRAALKCSVQPMLSSAEEIDQLLADNYRILEGSVKGAEEIEIIQYGNEGTEDVADKLKEIASGSKIISEVNRIMLTAIKEEASDIHIEPLENTVKVRSRIDGVLEERLILAKKMHLPIVTRIKIIGGMDIAERRVPQDGRVRAKVGGKRVDMRLSTYPTMHGEKVVVRLLSSGEVYGIETLGFDEFQRKTFEDIILKPYGIFLVSGPTGSGKTTTLYAALQRLNSQDRNIISIEDPIENEIPGVNQAQVNIKAGMTFASAMRSILRQDPDVIMLGEIRDQETADIAVRAAITGHLVFSTIHTNTALGAVTRLEDLGVEPFMTASALVGMMSQRLVRKICKHCKHEVEPDPVKFQALQIDENIKVYKGKGCKYCRMSGYSGRLGLFRVIRMSVDIKRMIVEGASEAQLNEAANKLGIKELKEQGVARIMDGTTTIEEVLRVTNVDL